MRACICVYLSLVSSFCTLLLLAARVGTCIVDICAPLSRHAMVSAQSLSRCGAISQARILYSVSPDVCDHGNACNAPDRARTERHRASISCKYLCYKVGSSKDLYSCSKHSLSRTLAHTMYEDSEPRVPADRHWRAHTTADMDGHMWPTATQ